MSGYPVSINTSAVTKTIQTQDKNKKHYRSKLKLGIVCSKEHDPSIRNYRSPEFGVDNLLIADFSIHRLYFILHIGQSTVALVTSMPDHLYSSTL